MPTQTYNRWPDPVIEREGIDQNEAPRKKRIRKYSFIYCVKELVWTLILTAAFLTIMAVLGNTIEFIARL